MHLLKYFAEDGGPEHNGQLKWPGTAQGYPVRNPQQLNLRDGEYENIQHVLDYHCQQFKLWEPQDLELFKTIMDRIANGWYALRNRKDFWSEQNCGLIVWLEWLQIYGEMINGKHPSAAPEPEPISILPD